MAHDERPGGRAKHSMSRFLDIFRQRMVNNQLTIYAINDQMTIISDQYDLSFSAY